MPYQLETPCNNFPSVFPQGQGDCEFKDTCVDRHVLDGAIHAIHQIGGAHLGSGTIILACNNKLSAQ
jgi:hypothetical protein